MAKPSGTHGEIPCCLNLMPVTLRRRFSGIHLMPPFLNCGSSIFTLTSDGEESDIKSSTGS